MSGFEPPASEGLSATSVLYRCATRRVGTQLVLNYSDILGAAALLHHTANLASEVGNDVLRQVAFVTCGHVLPFTTLMFFAGIAFGLYRAYSSSPRLTDRTYSNAPRRVRSS